MLFGPQASASVSHCWEEAEISKPMAKPDSVTYSKPQLHMLLICFTGTEGRTEMEDEGNETVKKSDRELREMKKTWEKNDKTSFYVFHKS